MNESSNSSKFWNFVDTLLLHLRSYMGSDRRRTTEFNIGGKEGPDEDVGMSVGSCDDEGIAEELGAALMDGDSDGTALMDGDLEGGRDGMYEGFAEELGAALAVAADGAPEGIEDDAPEGIKDG